MIGATITCSRSRQPAAIKRDTVCAPPSIRMRRKPALAQRRQDRGRRDLAVARRRSRRSRRRAASCGLTPSAVITRRRIAVVGQHLGVRRQASARVEHDARRARPGAAPHRQQRVVRDRRADADQHRIDQRAQPVQMRKTRRAVDVFGMSGDRRDPAVDRLPDLADHHEIVDRPLAQRAEPLLPRLRQGAVQGAEIAWNFLTTLPRYRWRYQARLRQPCVRARLRKQKDDANVQTNDLR